MRWRLPTAAAMTVVVIAGLTPEAAMAVDVSVTDGELLIVDGEGKANVIDVETPGLVYHVYDDRGPIRAGVGCESLEPKLVECTALVMRIRANTGRRDDLIGFREVDVPVKASGGAGHDLLEAGNGPVVFDGGDGVDSLVGGDDVDRLDGNDGDDLLEGRGAGDTMDAGSGDDIVAGQAGTGDILLGGSGRDLLRGGPGSDQLEGGDQNDVLIGGRGADEIGTGQGVDQVFRVDASDSVDCRAGDRVRGGPKWIQRECGELPAGVREPRSWPKQGARRSIIPPDPGLRGWLRRRGNATRYSVLVMASEDYPIQVEICTYGERKRRLRRFEKTVRTMHKRTYSRPAPKRRAHYIRVKRARHGCR